MQQDKYKKQLLKQKEKLRTMLERFAQEDDRPEGDWDAEFPQFDGGDLEEATDEVEKYGALRSIEHTLEVKLQKTNKALERLKNDTFGKCLECGEKIKKERLELMPETEKCKDCN